MTAAALDPSHPAHPVATVVASVRRELRSVADTPVWSMTAAETGDALIDVTRLEAQVAQMKLRLLAHADRVDVGSEVGATSAVTWWPTRRVRRVRRCIGRPGSRSGSTRPTRRSTRLWPTRR